MFLSGPATAWDWTQSNISGEIFLSWFRPEHFDTFLQIWWRNKLIYILDGILNYSFNINNTSKLISYNHINMSTSIQNAGFYINAAVTHQYSVFALASCCSSALFLDYFEVISHIFFSVFLDGSLTVIIFCVTNSACMKIPLHFSQTEMNSGLRVLENQEQIPPPRNQANTIWKTTGITSCLESFCEYSPPWVYQCASVLVLRTENSIQARQRGELSVEGYHWNLPMANTDYHSCCRLQKHRNKKFLLQITNTQSFTIKIRFYSFNISVLLLMWKTQLP